MRIAVKKRLGMLEKFRYKIAERPESNIIIYDPAHPEEGERAAREFHAKHPNGVSVMLPKLGPEPE